MPQVLAGQVRLILKYSILYDIPAPAMSHIGLGSKLGFELLFFSELIDTVEATTPSGIPAEETFGISVVFGFLLVPRTSLADARASHFENIELSVESSFTQEDVV